MVKRDRESALLVRIGRAIRAARERAGRTQEEAASLADIDAKRWQRLEAGAVNPTIRTLVRVARVCGIDVFALFALADATDGDVANRRSVRSGAARSDWPNTRAAKTRARSRR